MASKQVCCVCHCCYSCMHAAVSATEPSPSYESYLYHAVSHLAALGNRDVFQGTVLAIGLRANAGSACSRPRAGLHSACVKALQPA